MQGRVNDPPDFFELPIKAGDDYQLVANCIDK